MCVLSLGLTVTCVYTDNSARNSDMTSRIGMRVRNGRRVGFGWCRCGHQTGRQQCRLANAIILNTAIKAAWTLGTAGSLQPARLTPAQCRKVTSTLLLCFTLNLLAILERLQQWQGSLAKNWKVKSKLFFSFPFFFFWCSRGACSSPRTYADVAGEDVTFLMYRHASNAWVLLLLVRFAIHCFIFMLVSL